MSSGKVATRLGVALATALVGVCALGHEVRPAYLRIDAVSEEHYDVLWKVPLAGGMALPLAPVFPADCTAVDVGLNAVAADALVRRFKLHCPNGLRGGTVAVDGLSNTITDAMLHVALADGTRIAGVLRGAAPALVIDEAASAPVLGYFRLGVDHLLFGFDHILFVLSLLYFLHRPTTWARAKALATAVTAFTVAHSITLGLAALDLVRLPQAPVEAVIALSILFLAVERLRGTQRSLTVDHTWIVAFAFGLLHGFGFAGALADIGLPPENLPLALFLFNIGVEAGQLVVVAAALLFIWLLAKVPVTIPQRVVNAPLAISGCLAAYWFVGRTVAIVG